MSNATFTLLGIYQYGKRMGDDFFEKLTFPTGIDKSVVVNNLLLECADYEVLYPDYDFMKSLVEIFSKKYERTFTKWLAVQSIDYEPLDNYDNFVKFVHMVSDEHGLNISQRNISLSTCGLVPEIKRLAEEGLQVNLSLSLHNPFDEKRK